MAGGSATALLSAVVMLVAPGAAAAAAKRHRPRADLKITSLVANFGDPAYAVVGTDGVMEPIQVRVGIKSQGRIAAPPSILDVFYQDSARKHHQLKIRVPRLKVSIHSRFFTRGHGRHQADARSRPARCRRKLHRTASRRPTSDNNFFKGEHFEVIARQWDVPYFDTIVTVPGEGTRTTSSQSSFHFEFSYYDHSKEVYVYLPMGSISSTMVYAGGLCSGTGSLTDSKAPWGGFLHIAGNFTYYDALVDTTSDPIHGAGQLHSFQQDGSRGVRRA